MKTRNGFVSNSSSSSFVVMRKDYLDNTTYLSKEDEKKLRKFGFKKVSCCYADQVEFNLFDQEMGNEVSKEYQYGYFVSCNQDNVIWFLLKNNITFEGFCNYGHYHVFYQKDSKHFVIIPNYGQQATMTNWRSDKNYNKLLNDKKFTRDSKIFEIINVKEWLDKNENT